jgi:hypothetical protein
VQPKFVAQPTVVWLKETLGGQIGGCFACCQAFHRARGRAIESEDGQDIKLGLDEWDAERLSAALVLHNSPDGDAEQRKLTAYLEVLMRYSP